MKIAIFTDDFLFPPHGGVEQHILALAPALSARGHEVRVFSPNNGNNDSIIKSWQEKGFSFPPSKLRLNSFWSVPLSFLWPSFRGAFPLYLYFSLGKWQPEVIHWHTPGPVGLTATILAKVLRVRLIGTFHGYFMSGEYLKSSQPILSHFESLTRLVTAVFWRWGAFLYNRCDTVVTPTRWVAADIETHGYARPKAVIATASSLAEFMEPAEAEKVIELAQRYGLKASSLLYVGRVSREKSLDLLLKALSILKSDVSGQRSDVNLMLVGEGNAVPELKKLAESLGVLPQVKFLGRINHNDLPQSGVYEAADLFVIPSTTETLSIVTLEAMSKGLPVVAPQQTAVAELISGNGLLFKAGDYNDLSEKISEILSNEDTKKRMAERSKIRAQDFTLDKSITKLEKVYADGSPTIT